MPVVALFENLRNSDTRRLGIGARACDLQLRVIQQRRPLIHEWEPDDLHDVSDAHGGKLVAAYHDAAAGVPHISGPLRAGECDDTSQTHAVLRRIPGRILEDLLDLLPRQLPSPQSCLLDMDIVRTGDKDFDSDGLSLWVGPRTADTAYLDPGIDERGRNVANAQHMSCKRVSS